MILYQMESRLAIVLIFCINALVNTNCFAQENSVFFVLSDTASYRKHKAIYAEYAKEQLGISNRRLIERYHRNKINVSKNDEIFEAFGMDIQAILNRVNIEQQHLNDALIAPVSIIGEVVSKTHDARREAHYHTTYFVKVKKVIYSDLKVKLDTIQLKMVSGPVEDKGIGIVGTPHFPIGEQALIFLHPIADLLEKHYGQSIRNEKILRVGKAGLEKWLKIDFDDLSIFLPRSKYAIIGRKVQLYRKNVVPLRKVVRDVRRLRNINNRDDFYDVGSYVY